METIVYGTIREIRVTISVLPITENKTRGISDHVRSWGLPDSGVIVSLSITTRNLVCVVLSREVGGEISMVSVSD